MMKSKWMLVLALALAATTAVWAGWCKVCAGDECVQYGAAITGWVTCGAEDVEYTLNCKRWERRLYYCKGNATQGYKFQTILYENKYCLGEEDFCHD